MHKARLTVFLCTGKDCSRAWRFCGGPPGKWLKRQVKAAGLPLKLTVVKTACMDRCERAACLCLVHSRHACFETDIRSADEADRLLASLRACAESSELPH
jgi:hypothetical protein